MKHIRILGLCVLVAFALAAVTAASAYATEPAVYECHKLSKSKVTKKYEGKYIDKKCSKEATKAEIEAGKSNKYELQEWSKEAKKNKVKAFKGSGGESFLESHALEGTVKCKSFKDSAEITSAKTAGHVKVEFLDCELTKHTCTSVGPEGKKAPTGDIVPETLSGEIGYTDKASHEVGLDLHPEDEAALHAEGKPAYLARVECNSGAIKIRVSGSVVGLVLTPANVFTKELKLSYRQSEGVQKLQRLEGALKDTLGLEVFTEIPFPPEPCDPAGFEQELKESEEGKEPVRRACLKNGGFQTEAVSKGEELELKA